MHRTNVPHDFLQLAGKNILVMGVANKRSVAYHTARLLEEAGAHVVYSVRSNERREQVEKLVGDAPLVVCDVEREEEIASLPHQLAATCEKLHGVLHAIAFADYEEGIRPFHETKKQAFLRAVDVSCYSLIGVSNVLRHMLDGQASVVTISISTTRMASENYGYMAPVKAALDSALAMLAKSFSRFSEVRFNAVAAGLLKTSSSAGIPGYIDAYLYAEHVIPRHLAVKTEEVAATAAFLLSPRASGINAQRVVVDAGMEINYFDGEVIRRVVQGA